MLTDNPGFLIKQVEENYHKPQRFIFRNGLKLEESIEDKKPKISRAFHLIGNDTYNYNNIPSLCFTAFYRDKLGEEEIATTRFRKCNVSYYLEDDEIRIYEPLKKNSGLSQGCIVGKARFRKPEGGYYSIDDLNIGNTLTVHGREFTLINCDPFTRKFLTEMGYRVRSPQPDISDPIIEDREEMNVAKSYRKPYVKDYKVTTFLKYHPKQLRFYGYYGEGKKLFEERKEITLYYDLANGKIKIVEERGTQEEKSISSVILRAILVPKKIEYSLFIGEMADPTLLNLAHDIKTVLIGGQYYKIHNPDAGLADSNPVDGRKKTIKYFTDKDLDLGIPLNMFNSIVFLHDCDGFTKSYYRATYNKEIVPIPRPEGEVCHSHQLVYQHQGAGEPNHTIGNVNFLHPGVKSNNLMKYFKHSKYGFNAKQLKFFAREITEDPVEKSRRFVVCFYLEDDTITVKTLDDHHEKSIDLPFFKRMKVAKPQSIYENAGQCFYKSLDMYVGNVIYVRGRSFKLLEADEYTYDYMERHADVFPMSNVRLIMATLRTWIPTKCGLLKSRFEEKDSLKTGTINYNNFKEAIWEETPEEMKIKFSEHALKTIARYYAEDCYIGLKLKDLISRVQTELYRKKFYDFEDLHIAFSVHDTQNTGLLDPDRVYYILRTTSLPVDRDLLKSFIYKFPKTENKVNYKDIIKAMDWVTDPTCFTKSDPYAIQINWQRIESEKNLSKIRYNTFLMDAMTS